MARAKTTGTPKKRPTARKPRALREENIPYETDYYAASGAALLPSPWALQMAFLAPMLDEKVGILNTADVVVSVPWPLAKALAFALQQAVDNHDSAPLEKSIADDIKKYGGLSPALLGTRRG